MEFLRPESLAGALAARAAHPDAVSLAGGTDVMVELNFARRRPSVILDLTRVRELADWSTDGQTVRLGAAVTYAELTGERVPRRDDRRPRLHQLLPGLAMAARTVGSPQIRNRGTIGGNLGSASPAGDCHPVLLACGAKVEASSVRGQRLLDINDFFTGVKRTALAADELITAVLLVPSGGPEQFAKIGTRNAMVIAVTAFALALDPAGRSAGTGIGSAAPTPIRGVAAEQFLAAELADAGLWDSRRPIPGPLLFGFGERVSAAASPIDDVRGTAAYRKQALAVLARRTLTWAWRDYCAAELPAGKG